MESVLWKNDKEHLAPIMVVQVSDVLRGGRDSVGECRWLYQAVTPWRFVPVVLFGPYFIQAEWLTALFCVWLSSWDLLWQLKAHGPYLDWQAAEKELGGPPHFTLCSPESGSVSVLKTHRGHHPLCHFPVESPNTGFAQAPYHLYPN